MEKTLLTINTVDYSEYLKAYNVEYEVRTKAEGTNARGSSTLSVLSRKARINLIIRPTTEDEMAVILSALQPYSLTIGYWDIETKTQKTGTFVTSTAIPDMYTNADNNSTFKDFSFSLQEL